VAGFTNRDFTLPNASFKALTAPLKKPETFERIPDLLVGGPRTVSASRMDCVGAIWDCIFADPALLEQVLFIVLNQADYTADPALLEQVLFILLFLVVFLLTFS
jgi:hypothetical protein